MDWNDEQCWAAVSMVEGIGPKKFYQLLAHYGSIRQVFDKGPTEAGSLSFLGPQAQRALEHLPKDASGMLKDVQKANVQILTRLSPEYPALLGEVYDPPPILFFRGNLALLSNKMVAVIGSRRATRNGLEMAAQLAGDLSRAGVTVVSGMARGIDTQAHQSALEGKGNTVAVFGCGVDVCYPPENRLLKQQLEDKALVISEYRPGVQPMAQHFPARNRIISGLSLALVLVEAAEKSGAMITVGCALEQGREVLAVPGSPLHRTSEGPNRLIREGAQLVTCANDVLEALGLEGTESKPLRTAPPPDLDLFEARVVSAVEMGECSYDELTRLTGMEPHQLSCVLTMLELRGIIKKLPGNQYGL